MSSLYVVRYSGPFGFIKPWTAVRDTLTFSQTYLTPSIVEGMRQKLEVSAILRHRLQHHGISAQQEHTQSAGWNMTKTRATRATGVIDRGVMIEPSLWLAFPTGEDAEIAAAQHICLCRNEDVLLSDGTIIKMINAEFDRLPGIELLFETGPNSFLVGFNRFADASPMYGRMIIVHEE